MPLSNWATLQQVTAAHLQELINLLTGVMTDQPVTIGNTLAATALSPSGLTGSVSASRYVGATASGAPTTGAHLVGDWVIDLAGKIWLCTTAGTPGTWTQVAASSAPLGTLGYSQNTGDTAQFTAQLDIGLSQTVTIGAGRRIRISFRVQASSTVNSDAAIIYIMEGATQLGTSISGLDVNVGRRAIPGGIVLQPSAGTHTWRLQAARYLGTGFITIEASPTNPSWFLVEDIGV